MLTTENTRINHTQEITDGTTHEEVLIWNVDKYDRQALFITTEVSMEIKLYYKIHEEGDWREQFTITLDNNTHIQTNSIPISGIRLTALLSDETNIGNIIVEARA